MNEWFTPEIAPWFSMLSFFSLLAIASIWIEKGQYRTLIMSLYVGSLGFGIAILGAGIVARFIEQPPHVTFTLLRTGVVFTVIFGVMIGVVRAGYAKAEQRKMLAQDL